MYWMNQIDVHMVHAEKKHRVQALLDILSHHDGIFVLLEETEVYWQNYVKRQLFTLNLRFAVEHKEHNTNQMQAYFF